MGCKNIILTGVSYRPGFTGILVLENGIKQYYDEKYDRNNFIKNVVLDTP